MLNTLKIPSVGRLLAALALLGLTWTGEARAELDESGNQIRWGNGIRTEVLSSNALTTHEEASIRMVSRALNSVTYATDDLLRYQLEDPNAREVMKYVASCALDKTQSLEWSDRFGHTHTWKGELGLCPEWGWDASGASLTCQRWVSACVLARNNAFGYRVLLSMRGNHPASALTPRPSVMTDTSLRFTRVRVPSTYSCSASEMGATRECGYERAQAEPHEPKLMGSVGYCSSPGLPVDLGAGGKPPASCDTQLGHMLSGDMVLRVCEGLGACDEDAALAQSQGSCGTIYPGVTFTCPRSRTFNVMLAPYSSNANWGSVEIGTRAPLGGSVSYPATEAQVFPIREGAFFGNLFGSGAVASGMKVYVDSAGVLHRKLAPVQGSIYPKMYACHDPNWTDGAAYNTARLCARPGMNCVAASLGACNAWPACEQSAGGYSTCTGGDGARYSTSITTYLNRACDVVQNPALCKTANSSYK
ncbi:hypothetical protein ACN28E_04910 [Archangium lansingense]|uniref:hypothetical protein n=1 Tax=Archangium lansingense TaxID=2995310 RepID=UPI003B808500